MASTANTETLIEPGTPEGTKDTFPPFDTDTFAPQLVWLAITFGFLYMMMSRFALPRIAAVLEERHDRIADDLDKAEELKGQTEQAIAAYEKSLADARAKAHAIAAETHAEIMAEVEAQRAETDRQINAKLAEAEKQIHATKTAALAHVRDVATDTAGIIVERLLGSAPDAKAVGSAVEAELGHTKAAE
ncbi:MAG: F0F1 ATP synthase subunit B' [Alphaproteobacteria bacterium]